MGWGGLLFKIPEGIAFEDLPNDTVLSPIGDSEQILTTLTRLFPHLEHRAGFSTGHDETGYLELSYETAGPVDSIGVRSSISGTAMFALQAVCDEMGVVLYDCQTGALFDFGPKSEASLARYREWWQKVRQEL